MKKYLLGTLVAALLVGSTVGNNSATAQDKTAVKPDAKATGTAPTVSTAAKPASSTAAKPASSTAAKPASSTAAKPADSSKPDPTHVYEEGFAAMRMMHAARVSIFNGEPEQAVKLMEEATKTLNSAATDEAATLHKSDLVPIDGSLSLADTFVPSPKKAEHISKANEHFKSGKSQEGIEQLRLGEVDVTFQRVLMPLEATKKRLGDAVKLAAEHKYYEANLALKAAENGLEVDSVTLIEFPVDGKAAKNATAPAKATAPVNTTAPQK